MLQAISFASFGKSISDWHATRSISVNRDSTRCDWESRAPTRRALRCARRSADGGRAGHLAVLNANVPEACPSRRPTCSSASPSPADGSQKLALRRRCDSDSGCRRQSSIATTSIRSRRASTRSSTRIQRFLHFRHRRSEAQRISRRWVGQSVGEDSFVPLWGNEQPRMRRQILPEEIHRSEFFIVAQIADERDERHGKRVPVTLCFAGQCTPNHRSPQPVPRRCTG